MKATQLISELQKLCAEHGDIDVMAESEDGGITLADVVSFREVEEGEYPPDWNMPVGYRFICIG